MQAFPLRSRGLLHPGPDKPVIGVPVSGTLKGMDALLSIAQMPKGVPVACVGRRQWGKCSLAGDSNSETEYREVTGSSLQFLFSLPVKPNRQSTGYPGYYRFSTKNFPIRPLIFHSARTAYNYFFGSGSFSNRSLTSFIAQRSPHIEQVSSCPSLSWIFLATSPNRPSLNWLFPVKPPAGIRHL